MAGHTVRHSPIYRVQPPKVNTVGHVSQPHSNTEIFIY